jgi:hypothetical protein
MPRDADLGRELASELTALYAGKVTNVLFTYDSYMELDRMNENEPYCIVSTNLYEQIRETRHHWRETTQLVITLVSAIGPTNNAQWIDDWLDSWDMTVRNLRELSLFGKHKPVSIDIETRYDTDLFHNSNRLVTQAMLNYLNVEVL